MPRHEGSCHCGPASFSFTAPEITRGMRCDCSICARKGAMPSPEVIAPGDLDIRAEPGALSTYQFGMMTARHHFCNRYGIHTFGETRLNPGH
jgi:hypothetical protein